MRERASEEFRQWFTNELPHWVGVARGIVEKGLTHPCVMLAFEQPNSLAIEIPLKIEGLDDETAKDVLAEFHQVAGSAPSLFAALLIMEAWIASVVPKPGEAIPTRVSTLPNRREAIVFNAIHGDQQLVAHAMISRQPDRLDEADVIVDPAVSGDAGRFLLPAQHH